VQKLLRHGDGWLAAHPERKLIAARYLKHRRTLVDDALAQLVDENDPHPDETEIAHAGEEADLEDRLTKVGLAVPCGPRSDGRGPDGAGPSISSDESAERSPSLHDLRLGTVLAVLKASGAQSILDLGCGEGELLRRLLGEKQLTRIAGLDVSHRALEIAADKLKLDRLPAAQRERLTLLHGSLTYRDERLAGFDAAAVVEVIEHLDPPRLTAFERVLFECARPTMIVITTPNREYNVKWETLPAGTFRHRDHRFEWTRAEFRAWADAAAARFGYAVRFMPVGPEDADVGAPTQAAVFSREAL
jgi:3' terminal RNA ribose 2'-O-methyltransferase Hen1